MNTKVTAILQDGTKIKGRLTTDHAASSYGQPVFVDEANQVYDWFQIASINTAAEMGSARSERKTNAVRENGKKGGRPRKPKT